MSQDAINALILLGGMAVLFAWMVYDDARINRFTRRHQDRHATKETQHDHDT